MRGLSRILFVLSLALVPVAASAQSRASIAGIVKNASGAVLPGVTVEASSPVLIEKVRSAVTDGTGQYRITELLPGPYIVTFTLTGFSTLKREGIELSGSLNVPLSTTRGAIPIRTLSAVSRTATRSSRRSGPKPPRSRSRCGRCRSHKSLT